MSIIACALGTPVEACAQLRGKALVDDAPASLPVAANGTVLTPAPAMRIGTLSSERTSTDGTSRLPLLQERGGYASVSDSSNASPTVRNDGWIPGWRDIRGDVLNVVGAPLQLNQADALRLVGASGLVVGVVAGLDRPAARRVPSQSGSNIASIATPASAPGRWYDSMGPDRVALSTVGAFAVTGLALREKQFTHTSFNLVEAMVLTKVATGLFKGIAGRTRPYTGSGPWDVNTGAFSSRHERKSMPSGHTSRAFAIASVIAHDYPKWYVQIPAYTFAASAGVQRIRSGNHWLSDVVVGGALGYLIGRTVAQDGRPRDDGRITYDPIVGSNQLGLRVRF